jgi:hypothetical protein
MPQVSGTFSAYPVQVVLNGAGYGTVEFQAVGSNIRISNGFVRVATSAKQATATVYKGFISPGSQLSNTPSGSTGAPFQGPVDLYDGEKIIVEWVGGDVGALATATFTGKQIPFDPSFGETSLNFDSITVAGDGSLVFPAIHSPNYVAGVSGWTINRDGTSEFQNVVVRGSFEADGPGGTYVKGYVTTVSVPSGIATLPVIDFQPPDLTVGPAGIFSYTDGVYSLLGLNSPIFGTDEPATLLLRDSTTGDSSTAITAQTTFFIASNIALVGPDLGDIGRGKIAYVGSTVNSAAVGNANTNVLTTATTTFRANRAYQVTLAGRLATSAVAMDPSMTITTATPQTLYTYGRLSCQLAAQYMIPNGAAIFKVGSSDLARAVSLTLISNTAGQTVIHVAGRWMVITDIGPASDYPDVATLA